MKPKIDTKIKDFFLEIFGEGNQDMIKCLTPGFLERFQHLSKHFFKEEAKEIITKKISEALKMQTGDRQDIIKKTMKETPFFYHYSLIEKLWNKECEKTKKHLYYYLYSDRDMHESDAHYKCIYCRKREERSRRASLDGEIARTTYQAGEKLEEGNKLLAKIVTTNPTKKEIEQFSDIIVDLAL